ncbi:MAG: aspartate carbamoyltransferase [Candidatus Dormibacteraeota bacterium]|nr:aspartate carbamoyltransferase [Candidatus Dormibacteraeota bacterium]MBV8445972.1 aspartate carbamoyltransferase [Candidatus Dormibacteraeota bacterium]
MTTAPAARTALTHVISSEQFDRARLDDLFVRAAELDGARNQRCAGQIMATLFYEPSTRTRLSFESAMLRLGGTVLGTEAAHAFSSAIKGETLEDTIRMVSTYADVIVLRHDQLGAASRAAAVAAVPVINAGDGPGEHPTQALLDLFTIQRELGRIDGVHVAFCGDLRYGRTARSLALLLALYPGVCCSFVAPDVVQVGADILSRLDDRGVPHREVSSLADVIDDADVVYQTRVQKERFGDPAEFDLARTAIRIDADVMRALPQRAIVMHPLPRVDEIAPEVDADPRAAYFRQAANGVAIRMAVLDSVLS